MTVEKAAGNRHRMWAASSLDIHLITDEKLRDDAYYLATLVQGYAPSEDGFVRRSKLPDSAHIVIYCYGDEDYVEIPVAYFSMTDEAVKAAIAEEKEAKKRRDEERRRQMMEEQHLKNRDTVKKLLLVAKERYPGLLTEIKQVLEEDSGC